MTEAGEVCLWQRLLVFHSSKAESGTGWETGKPKGLRHVRGSEFGSNICLDGKQILTYKMNHKLRCRLEAQ
jgi:hypothetical protein